ncbi:MAG: DNA recombination protein RmuC [Cellvibrionales bacterium]|jgi:DNA recombination protein RmuC|nr:DNA recombination protein RmuC [Cellvibrionales bacterium]
MEFNIFTGTAFLIIACCLITFVIGLVYGRIMAKSQASETLSQLNAEKLVLEEKLSNQETNFEAQLKLVKEAKQSLSQEFENLANRIFDDKQTKFSEQSKQALDTSLSPLRRDIGDFRKQVSSAYEKENADRNQLAGQIGELQKQTMKISSEAASLANALKGDNKQQGNWGEFVLEKLLEDSGLSKGREYETQVALKDEEGKRRNPDVIIRLPEGKDIIIDAKTSLLNYERYFHAENEQQRQEFLKNHLNSLRAHIKGLDIKNYEKLETINSLDFVLIFIPVESAFMLALDNDPDIMREAYDRGIILVSPSTLMVTLRTIKNLWRYADQNINAQQIAEKAGGLYDLFVLHVEALEDIGKHLDKSKDAYETAFKRLSTGRGNLVKRSEELKLLGAKTKKAIADKLLPASDT